MLTSLITSIVDLSRRCAWLIIVLALIAAGAFTWYVAGHFKINTDINQLLSSDLDWKKREAVLEKAFPQKTDITLIVIDGDTPSLAESAAASLSEKLSAMPEKFSFVTRPDSNSYFHKYGFLLLPKEELEGALTQMAQAQPFFGMLTSDPSLRGFFGTIGLMMQGVQHGAATFDQFDKPFSAMTDTIDTTLQGKDMPLAFESMAPEAKITLRETRKFIIAKPVLDYTALQPGEAANNVIRSLANEMNLTPEHGVHLRLTGPVPLNDEEFASVANGTGFATALSGILVFVLLLVALRSLKIVLPILLTLMVGLSATTAFALAAIGSLNLISVAFAVMFIGIAVDFGIQFGVRYRDQHHQEPDHSEAMRRTARTIAIPLSMAAGSTTLGFLAFIPTDYRGVSELGMIAGAGMFIAFLLNITLLPALLTIAHPPAEPEAVGYKWLAPFDRLLQTQRRAILIGALIIALIGSGVATRLSFDFDPLDLKDPHTESVSTLLDLMKDPDFNSYTIEILRPTLDDAKALATQLEQLPEVDHVMTLNSFVPDDQEAKLAMIADTNALLGPTLSLPAAPTPPTDEEIYGTIKKVSDSLRPFADKYPSAARFVKALDNVVAQNNHDLLVRLQKNLITGMQSKLEVVKQALGATAVTPDMITDDIKRDWVTANGQYLVEVYPKGDPRNHDHLIAFTDSVRKIAPDASGSPISIQEGGRTVTHAFIHAGIYALLAIGLLSFLILRSLKDVAILMAPLILAGILTIATIVAIDLPLNFANIIALPLLLSLGVSYAIYFVSYSRAGLTNPLQSSMARAVLFSAATVLVAFGSLALSSHPGTAGMGKLLTVALIYSLLCTFFVLPALCGRGKSDKD